MLETQSTVCVMLHCICLITWNPPPTLASSGLCWVKRAKREICTCDNSNAHLQTKLVGEKNCSFVLCLQPMRQLRPAPTSPCSLASSCWCHSWVWPCIARTAGAHRECARSWRPLWLSTCCTWNSSCGAAGYGWPCSDWDRPQGETWGLLYVFFQTPLFSYHGRSPGPQTPQTFGKALYTVCSVEPLSRRKRGKMCNPRNM